MAGSAPRQLGQDWPGLSPAERDHFQLGCGWGSFISTHMCPTPATYSEENMDLETRCYRAITLWYLAIGGADGQRAMEGLRTEPGQGVFAKQLLQKSGPYNALLDQWWYPGGWLACHPVQGDSTLTLVQPPHQELDACCSAGTETIAPSCPAHVL